MQQEPNHTEYQPLWAHILNPFSHYKLKDALPKADKLALRKVAFDEFVGALLKMLQRLTLTTYAVVVDGSFHFPRFLPLSL